MLRGVNVQIGTTPAKEYPETTADAKLGNILTFQNGVSTAETEIQESAIEELAKMINAQIPDDEIVNAIQNIIEEEFDAEVTLHDIKENDGK